MRLDLLALPVILGLMALILGLMALALYSPGLREVWSPTGRATGPGAKAQGPSGEAASVRGAVEAESERRRSARSTMPSASPAESLEAVAERRAGRLRILRGDGTWNATPDGELEVLTWSTNVGAAREVCARGTGTLKVRGGRFELSPELVGGVEARFVQPLAFTDATDQAAAIPFDGATLWSTASGLTNADLELSAAEAQPLSVTAIDGLSGAPLPRLSVEMFPSTEALAIPPGEWDAPAMRTASGAAPLILDSLPLLGGRSAECSLRVGAEGYAPTALVVDRREPAALEVVLWPAASLLIRTSGHSEGASWLEVERLDGRGQVARHLLSGAARELSGLAPGVYGVTWVQGSATGVQRRLDRASVHLSSGEAREVWLEAPSRKPIECASQVAELWLPESWFELPASEDRARASDAPERMLVLRSAQACEAGSMASPHSAWSGGAAPTHGAIGRGLASLGSVKHDGAPGRLFEFSAAGLPAGRYAATLIPEGVVLWMELQPFGAETPRFVAPEPVEWELDSHAVAELAAHEPPGPLEWSVELPGYQGPRIPREVLPNDEGRYVFLAPRGELALQLTGTAWAISAHQQRTDIPRQTLELVPLTQFGLFLQLEGQPFPWSGRYELGLHSDTGEDAVYAFEGHSLLSRLGVGTPGAYRVVVRAPSGARWASTPLYFGSVGHEKIVKLEPR